MDGFPLLSGKFAAAKLPEICAPRRELLHLYQKMAGKRLVFVSAPAGYGKTVSTQLWLNASGMDPIWIGLDRYDNTPSIFYKLFCTGILSTQPDNRAMAHVLKSPAFLSSPVEHTISLLSEYEPNERRFAVVLDDMHLVTNEEVRKSGLLIQKRLPSSFITLVLTRNEIAAEYRSMLDPDEYAILSAQDLAFSPEEIKKYFVAQGRPLTTAEAAAVHGVTGGWAIAVSALAMSGRTAPDPNGGPVLGHYIKAHIWNKWDETVRDFMLRTAIVDVISPKLANRLSGRADSRDILEELCAKNSFIRRAAEDAYCFHPLFLEFLRSSHEHNDDGFRNPLYQIAAQYYLETGDFFSSRRYALKSGDAQAIHASYAALNNGRSISIDEYVNFYKTLLGELAPEQVIEQCPYMYGTYIWYHCLTGNAQKMEHCLHRLYTHLPVIAKNHPHFAELSILITVVDHRSSFSQKSEQFGSYPAVFSAVRQLRGTSITMQLPYAHRTLRDFSELTDETVLNKLYNSFGRLLSTQAEVVVLELQSGFLYEQNRLQEALKAALHTQTLLHDEHRDEVVFCSYVHLASIYFALGNDRMFIQTVEQAQQYIDRSGSHYFRPNFTAFTTKLQLMNCNKSAAEAWLDHYFVVEAEQIELYKIFQYFTTARAHIVLAQTDRALACIAKLKQLARDFNRPLDCAEAGVLQAVVEWALGNHNAAMATLEEALVSVRQYDFIRVFADEGASILPILKKLAFRQQKEKGQNCIPAKFLNKVILAAYEQSKVYKGVAANITPQKPVKLSKQQKKVIELLSKGYKNAEIALVTGLSIHTVKSHCAAAYAKLKVNSALDAVLMAKELGFIE